MAKPVITITDRPDTRLVTFEIPGGVTTPVEFADAVREIADRLPGTLPVLLNGRGPVWGYAMLVHAAHPTPAVATFDPRLGYIVVATHDERFAVGNVIDSE
ncbi:MAG: CRISPR-associated ring nuclease Crn3/Csx3 [Patescibacteria group bacterium]|jgi:CRISPR-associated protein Csx3